MHVLYACVGAGSIQQLHYEMANNLMATMEIKLRKTYIVEATPKQHKHAADSEDESTREN